MPQAKFTNISSGRVYYNRESAAMTSRKLGKLLVYTNLVLSVFFVAWSLGLYSQRLDWAPHKNLISGQVTAETRQLYFLQDEIKRLLEQRDLAEIRWQKDAADLPN